MPKFNLKAWLIVLFVIAILLLMFQMGLIDQDFSNESRAFLRELRQIL